MCSPAVSTPSISVDPRLIGSAAGLYGITQMAVGATCTTLAGFGHDPAVSANDVVERENDARSLARRHGSDDPASPAPCGRDMPLRTESPPRKAFTRRS
jgi:hypothetical protein